MQHSNFTAAQEPSKRVKSEILLRILYSQVVMVMTDLATKSKRQKGLFSMSFWAFLTSSGPWWLFNFRFFLLSFATVFLFQIFRLFLFRIFRLFFLRLSDFSFPNFRRFFSEFPTFSSSIHKRASF
jgi:hypothetical protein